MAETLVIRFYDGDSDIADWVVVEDSGACLGAPSSGSLAAAAAAAAGRRIVVLAPATGVLRTTANVPVRGQTRVAQALPFALEDTLADDVDALHFAAGARSADGRVAAAAVRRDLFDQWLARLHAAGIFPAAMFAASDGVGEVPATTVLLVETDQVILRDPGGDPTATEPAGLEALLELWLAQERAPTPEGAIPPRNLLVYDATVDGVPELFWTAFRARVQSLEVHRLPDGALPRLAAAALQGDSINLLQGSYAPRSRLGGHWGQWRLAGALAAGLAAAALITAGVETWRLKREAAVLQQTLTSATQYAFPDAVGAPDLRAVVDQRTREASGAGSAADPGQFLDTLRIVSDAIGRAGNARLQSINYRSGIMEIQVRAPDAGTLDTIRKTVVDSGRLSAEIQSSNAEGDQIQGRLRITVAAS